MGYQRTSTAITNTKEIDMGKQKIIEAVKRKGLYVVEADWVATVSGSQWQIQFGMEMHDLYGQDEFQSFTHTAEALEWIDSLEPVTHGEDE